MAKTSGLGDRLLVGGFDLSGDTQAMKSVSGSQAVIDVTGIDKSAHERIGGRRDGHIEWTSHFNTSAGQAHPALSALPTSDVQVSYLRGAVLGNPAASIVAKQIGYNGTRNAAGAVTFDVSCMANGYGLEWGNQLTAGLRSDVTATSPATGFDQTLVSSSFGWQAYLHVTAITGTSATVTIQDSADNSTFAALAGGSAFTAATGATSQRIVSSSPTATVRRYVRAITTGTFTLATFAVIFVRNELIGVTF